MKNNNSERLATAIAALAGYAVFLAFCYAGLQVISVSRERGIDVREVDDLGLHFVVLIVSTVFAIGAAILTKAIMMKPKS